MNQIVFKQRISRGKGMPPLSFRDDSIITAHHPSHLVDLSLIGDIGFTE